MTHFDNIDTQYQAQVLRNKAEAVALKNNQLTAKLLAQLSDNEVTLLIQELQIHQIELEMQNEELRTTQRALDAERERYFDLYDLAPVGYLTLDANGLILEANLTVAIMLSVTRSELIKHYITQFIYTEDQDIYYLYRQKFFESSDNKFCELRLIDKKNQYYWVNLIALSFKDTHIVRLILIDINEQKLYENELNRIAQHDVLTNLPNRILLSDRLHQGMVQVQQHGQHLAVVYFDLDGFKLINDTYGHQVGDQVLIAVSNRMSSILREGDTIARLGGDEFVAVLVDLKQMEDVIPLLIQFLEAISQPIKVNNLSLQVSPIQVDNLSLRVSASLGVSFYPQQAAVDSDVLLRQADQAMYQAKLAGRNRYHFFDTAQESILREHYEIMAHIQQALDLSEFVLYYQPKVNMRTGVIIGVEALIRWQHPNRGLLQPAEFLPLIEDNDLSVRLGEWVINRVLSQMEQWQDEGLTVDVSANVTARQLKDNSFIACLQEILAAHPKINPAHLELEVLETSKLDNINKTAAIMNACKTLGVHFSLDDFGTGYSSLAYLQHLPISTMKIDQSFIRDMIHNTDNLSILSAILGLARAFGHDIIAEGVETIEHGQLLLKMGCEFAQGYAIARPMPADAFIAWSKTWQPDASWQNAS
jgi:diguanylate cyclase (GGDEF)-like protein/PAS domain S-box-containing protein